MSLHITTLSPLICSLKGSLEGNVQAPGGHIQHIALILKITFPLERERKQRRARMREAKAQPKARVLLAWPKVVMFVKYYYMMNEKTNLTA